MSLTSETGAMEPVLMHLSETRIAVSSERKSNQPAKFKFAWDFIDISILQIEKDNYVTFLHQDGTHSLVLGDARHKNNLRVWSTFEFFTILSAWFDKQHWSHEINRFRLNYFRPDWFSNNTWGLLWKEDCRNHSSVTIWHESKIYVNGAHWRSETRQFDFSTWFGLMYSRRFKAIPLPERPCGSGKSQELFQTAEEAKNAISWSP